jgi:hypothetical protein
LQFIVTVVEADMKIDYSLNVPLDFEFVKEEVPGLCAGESVWRRHRYGMLGHWTRLTHVENR